MSEKIQHLTIPNVRQQKMYDKYKQVPKQIKEVAEGMESQFINHMINEMRKTVHKNEPMGQAEKFYSSKMDEEYSKIMSESKNGLGLKNLIIEQLAPQYIRNDMLAKSKQGLRTYQKQQEVDSIKGGSHE